MTKQFHAEKHPDALEMQVISADGDFFLCELDFAGENEIFLG